MTRGVQLIKQREDIPDFYGHTQLAMGALVVHDWQKSTTVDSRILSQWARAVRNAFLDTLAEDWSVVFYTGMRGQFLLRPMVGCCGFGRFA
jgi:hypothetical protein